MEATSRETVKFVGRVGKPGNDIVYTHVKYFGNEYTVMKIKHNDGYVYGLIDKDDYSKIHEYSWHYTAHRYISQSVYVDGKHKSLYLHNMIMDRLEHPGKGATETIDHINRNGLDNRKDNLRLITQTEQNLNQKRKGRTIKLPDDIGIKVEDIPKHIWYIKPNGSHGERFGIDLKSENIKWKTTSAKEVSIQEKLKLAKEQLEEYYKLYPHLNPDNTENEMEMERLNHTYDEIIKLAE
jgi:hypothetical protein